MTQTTIERQSWREPEPATFDLSGIPRTAYVPLLALLYALGISSFVAIEPTKPWLLFAVVALVGFGTDGIVRNHARSAFTNWTDTAPFLFVPVLFALASGLFLDEIVTGYRIIPAVAVASGFLAAALYGEYVTTIDHGPSYALGRLLLNLLTYLSAFAFFAVVYEYDIGLLPAAFAIGLFAGLLALEIFREAHSDVVRGLLCAAGVGLALAQVRWALYFVPIDGFLAATTLLLVFYHVTGVLQHHLDHDFDTKVAVEFSVVTLCGFAAVVGARLLGLG